MKPSLNLILAAFGSLLIVSCYPYPEKKPAVRHRPNTEQQKKEAKKTEADKLKEKETAELEKNKKEEELNKEKETEKIAKDGEKNLPEPDRKPDRTRDPRPQYDVARKAPGKEGFVLSPYNQKLIDVRGIASGTLVQDPTYDASEKKYFRVP